MAMESPANRGTEILWLYRGSFRRHGAAAFADYVRPVSTTSYDRARLDYGPPGPPIDPSGAIIGGLAIGGGGRRRIIRSWRLLC